MRNKIFTLLFAVAASTGTMFAEKVQIGDLYYNLDGTNQTAEVTSQNSSNPYWSTVLTIVDIPASVTYNNATYSITSIGKYAFYGCSSLTSIEIPNNVTNIGIHSFQGCDNLATIILPNSVTSIGNFAFDGCRSLTTIEIPNNVTSIGSHAFESCSSLSSVIIPNGVTSIEFKSFYGCNSLTSVTIPNTVTSIGKQAFSGCTSLTSIEIPNSVTSIEERVFERCSSMTSTTIPNSVTNIGEWAFEYCSSLISVEIPNSITSIGYGVFSDCNSLTSVTIPNTITTIGEQAFCRTNLSSLIIPNSVTSIGTYAFAECTGLSSVNIPSSVKSIGNYAFKNVLNVVYLGTASGSPWGARSRGGYVDGYLVYGNNTKTNLLACSVATTGEISISNTVTSIGSHAFDGCSGLTSIEIPNSVTSIGEFAFQSCSGLKSITIPNSVKSIGTNAFRYVFNIVYSGTATGSPWGAENYNAYVDGYLIYSDDTRTNLLACSVAATGELSIPNTVTSIGSHAFDGCTGLTSPIYNAHVFAYMPTSYTGAYSIPNGIESIAGSAFSGCTGLISIEIPNSVTNIGGSAFFGCTGLTSIEIPNNVTSIGSSAFHSCTSLASIEISNNVTSIEQSAFYGCTGLRFITIPNSFKSIGYAAFSHCSGLTSMIIGNSVSNIENYAFNYCSSLTSITIGAQNPPTLSSTAFGHCSELNTIYVPCGSLDAYKSAPDWSSFASKIKYQPLPYTITTNAQNGNVKINHPEELTICSDITLTATPIEGYYFTQWSDGNTDNPRAIELTQDTTFTAEFSNLYNINISCDEVYGTIDGESGIFEYLSEHTYEAIPNYGYHFVQWIDGNTDNPRTIVLTQDTAFAAEFAKNPIIRYVCDSKYGYISGDTITPTGTAAYDITFEAISNYGYHFVQWSDGNKDNPRSIYLTQDTTFAAEFASNQYTITDNSDAAKGKIEGAGTFTYLNECELNAISNCGYHFTQWNDGNTDNPRTIVLTQDTTFTAEFAVNTSGQCGDNLIWSLEDNVLSITGSGDMWDEQPWIILRTEIQQVNLPQRLTSIGKRAFEHCNSLKSIIIPNSVTYIGNEAFKDCAKLTTITVPPSVIEIGSFAFMNGKRLQEIVLGENIETIGDSAFFNCPYILTIHAQMEFPPVISASVFADCGDLSGVDCYVPKESLAFYKKTAIWKSFNLIVGEKLFSVVALPYSTLLGYVTGTGAYAAGVEITMTATPAYGYHFTCWNDGNTNNPRTITVTADASYTALFAANDPTGSEEVEVTTTNNGATISTGLLDDRDVATYRLDICKDNITICVLTLDEEGHLTGIDFHSAPARMPQQTVAVSGLNIPITGLSSGTTYHYTLDALDQYSNILNRKEGDFTTTGVTTDIDQVTYEQSLITNKVLLNNQIFILRGEKVYTMTGLEVR